MSLIYNATFDSQTRVLSLLDKTGNVISSCEVPSKEPLVDDPNKPLMLRAIEDNSSVSLAMHGTLSNTYQTSTDGTNWTDYTLGTQISLNKGESVYFRCSNHPTTQTSSNYVQFYMLGKIEAWHNAYSMISSSFTDTSASVGRYGMFLLFAYSPSLTKAPLLLNALAPHCYDGLFYYCSPLKQAPSLPATTLADGCYDGMFTGCQLLTKAPELPATTLANGCYKGMFAECSNLKEVRISATTTAVGALYSWLYDVSATGDFYCDPNATIFPTDSSSGIPTGWTRIPKPAPAVDDITKPLTFRATQDGSTVKLATRGFPTGDFQTSRDGGNTWTNYSIGRNITLNTGDEVSFRAKADRTDGSEYYNKYFYFEMTGKIEAWHNVMSMIRTSDFATYDTVFGSGLAHLFDHCKSLTKAPILPATTLASYCYDSMFIGCESLTKAPELPATTLSISCYGTMFSGCQSLKEAPELPATTLASLCYAVMFANCASLTKAPELPATTLANYCYKAMFSGCQSLKEVRISATTTAPNALYSWLYDVSATGDFYCDPNATIFPTGSASGIPEGWSRHALADYPATP